MWKTRTTDGKEIFLAGSEQYGPRFGDLEEPVGPFKTDPGTRYLSDAYPRSGASLNGKPTVQAVDGGYEISFALDAFDDVQVRVVDEAGETVRTIGCGVLGDNAPEPFASGKLQQTVFWDGKDADGNSPAPGWSVEVSVGLEPRFGGFVRHQEGQMTSYLNGLQVDSEGRVYVSLHTAPVRQDPIMLRFNRDGSYDEMLYPSNPENLYAQGK